MTSEYTIKEALAELSISKATLYYRINKFKRKIEPHTLMKNGKKFISREGIEILRVNDGSDSLLESSDNELHCSDSSSDNPDNGSNHSGNEKQINNDAFNILKMENEFLKLQIREKDSQFRHYLDLWKTASCF